MKKNLFKVFVVIIALSIFAPTMAYSMPTVEVSAATKKSKTSKVSSRDFTLSRFKDVTIDENYKNLFQGWDYFFKTYSKYNPGFASPVEQVSKETNKMHKYLAQIKNMTRNGSYGFVNSDIIDFSFIQKKIKNVDDVLAYFAITRYSYAEDGNGFMDNNWMGWDIQHDAIINLENNCGVCCETAMIVNYLLEGDYDETGTVYVTSRNGHAYNYIKEDGIYYLIDFTNYTDGGFRDICEGDEDQYNDWIGGNKNNRICFWSGKSLTSDEATKAVLIHDTCEGNVLREKFNPKYTKKNTGSIVAIKYENTHDGCTPSFMTDHSFQQTVLESGNGISAGHYDDKKRDWVEKTYMIKEIRVYVPEGTTYYVMYLNQETDTDNIYCCCKWVDGGIVPIKQVPWFAHVNPKTDLGETLDEKFFRQTAGDALVNNSIKVGDVWKLQNSHIITNDLGHYDSELYNEYVINSDKYIIATSNGNIYEVKE